MKRLVVKVGSSTLCGDDGALDPGYIRELASVLACIRGRGVRVCLVTSGAVGTGARRLGIDRPQTVPRKQAAAAVGQGILMGVYAAAFDAVGLTAAQILLTRYDVADRTRYGNARNTFQTLFRCGVVPIVNENDSVATEELKFGDNDTLSALTALIVEADLAVILSDVEGLHDPADDRRQTIPLVSAITTSVESLARPAGSPAGTGGMVTKLRAARVLTRSGIPLVIASGREPRVVEDAVERWEKFSASQVDTGRPGTLFLPAPRKLRGRKRWLAYGSRAVGSLHVNERARTALQDEGRSLLAAGITSEIRVVSGRRSEDMPALLGREVAPEVIHRDNLVLEGDRPHESDSVNTDP
ncbi:MAG: glutamate 5-kinase [Chloroflexi bacterium]|nr:glutamate 5-kinase [Chloroflexota bacterium]